MVPKEKFRWVIVALLFYSTTIIYFDRVILGILAPSLTEQLGWSEKEFSYIVMAFQFTYTVNNIKRKSLFCVIFLN